MTTLTGTGKDARRETGSPRILVLGGTGKTGRRVAERLEARGVQTRIGSRRGTPPFDWERPETWGAALDGVTSIYLTYYPDLAVPGAVDTVSEFVSMAEQHNVEHVVLLSGRGEEEAQRAEAVVRESSLDWTIVRANWFAQNFSENYLLEPILAGDVALPAGDIPEPFVDAGDIADVVVAALTDERHRGETYEVSGPRLLTFAEAISEISAATGRDIRYIEVSPEAYKAAMIEQGVPDDFVWLVNYLFTTILDGRNASLTDGVQRALGREPRDFASYARETAATGIWNV